MCPRGACCRDSVSRRSCVSCVILVLCPRVSRLALHFLLCVFPSRCFSVPSLTCPLPSSLHLFLLPSLVSLSMCLPPRDATLPAFSTGTFPSVSVWYVSDYLYSACVCTLLLPFRLLLCLFVHCNSFLFFHCCFPRKPTHFPGACFEHRSTTLSFPTLRVMWKMAAV